MQIILQKNVPNLGLVGDVVTVAPGYYRNFLGPRSLALLANPGSIKEVEHQKKVIESKKAKEKIAADSIKAQLEKHIVKLSHAAGAGDKLFGSVTTQELVVSLRSAGFSLDRKLVKMEAPIKTLGEHSVEVKLHPEVVAKVRLEVVRKVSIAKKEEKESE